MIQTDKELRWCTYTIRNGQSFDLPWLILFPNGRVRLYSFQPDSPDSPDSPAPYHVFRQEDF